MSLVPNAALDLVTVRGNVVLREWEGEELVTSHTMTTAKARAFAASLLRLADEADAEMPTPPPPGPVRLTWFDRVRMFVKECSWT